MSSAQAHCTRHDLSAMTLFKPLPCCFMACRQLILTVRQTGPSSVQVQLLQGFTRFVWPSSNFTLFIRHDLRFSRQTVRSIEGKLEQATRGFLMRETCDYMCVIIYKLVFNEEEEEENKEILKKPKEHLQVMVAYVHGVSLNRVNVVRLLTNHLGQGHFPYFA